MPDVNIDQYSTIEQLETRKAEIKADLNDLAGEYTGRSFDADANARWESLNDEHDAIVERVAELVERKARLEKLAEDEGKTIDGDGAARSRFDKRVQVKRTNGPEDIYDLAEYRKHSNSPEEEARAMRDGAMRSVETSEFPLGNREDHQGHVEKLLRTVRGPEGLSRELVQAELSRRILATGSPAYKRAFFKSLPAMLASVPAALSPEESRALSVGTGSAGGFAVVYQLDPTIVPTSNFSVNPFRAIARVETIAGTNEWKAVTSGAITAAYAAEATEASDNTPTLAQPDIIVEKAQAYVPFSIEAGQDWSGLEMEMASLLQDAKDDLEATKFATGAGHGSQEPKGIITAATSTVGPAGGVGTFAIADLYAMFEALPARFRPRATWLAPLFTYDKVRQFDTAGGSGVWALDTNAEGQLQAGAGGTQVGSANIGRLGVLLSRNAYESTAMDAALTTTKKPLLIGDFRYFVIVDRVGMNLEVVPLVVGTNHRPTGQRGIYAYWRNSSDALSAAAFRVLLEP